MEALSLVNTACYCHSLFLIVYFRYPLNHHHKQRFHLQQMKLNNINHNKLYKMSI